MAKEVAVPNSHNLAEIHRSGAQLERFQGFRHALESVDDPRCSRPIPRFMLDMPWVSEEDEVAERIIAKMLASDDPYAVTNAGETLSGKNLVGHAVTVHDIRCSPSAFKGGWGAYLICDVQVDQGEAHEIMTIGAKEAVAILAFAHFRGDLPVTGTPTIVTETGNGNTVLGFIVERSL